MNANRTVRSDGRCVELVGIGGPERLVMRERDVPIPAPDEIGARVEAAGVAFADVAMRHGFYPGAPAFPFEPGDDFAGTVTGVGDRVEGFAVGDREADLSHVGAYAEHIAIEPLYVTPIGADTDAAAASALVPNYATAWQMMERMARVPDGGMALLELARRRPAGARHRIDGQARSGARARRRAHRQPQRGLR